MAKGRTEREDAPLVVIGKRKPGGRSDETIRALGLEDHVTFVTGVPDQRIIELYAEAQLAVVPSLYEGFSLPAIEAMSCGTPLLATSGGALPEVVGRDGETALVVEPGDSEALASKLRWALERDDLRGSVGAAGRARVVDQWSWKYTAARTVEQYRMLLDGSGRRPARTPRAARARAAVRRGTS